LVFWGVTIEIQDFFSTYVHVTVSQNGTASTLNIKPTTAKEFPEFILTVDSIDYNVLNLLP